jgi:hypothetical protein
MWYRNTIADGAEFIIVDPKAKTRKHAFDHQRLANALSNSDTTYQAFGLPFTLFEFTKNGRAISFDVENKTYTCNIRNYHCSAEENETIPLPTSSLKLVSGAGAPRYCRRMENKRLLFATTTSGSEMWRPKRAAAYL